MKYKKNKTSGRSQAGGTKTSGAEGGRFNRTVGRASTKSRNPRLKLNPKRRLSARVSPYKQEEYVAREAERLQKIISEAGLTSRRGAERLIAEGRVSVNGEVVTQVGMKAIHGLDRIEVDGRPIGPPQKYHYYMFHKPAGYLSTMDDPRGRPTIKVYLDSLPVRVFAVGRLDMDVEGLLFLTNDGALAKALMHPSSQVPKVYRVKVSGIPDEDDLIRLTCGQLYIGDKTAAPAEAELIKKADDRAWILLTITEGRKHQVKRMCSAIGHPVLKLKRIAYAGIPLGPLRREEIRPLTREEISLLKLAAKGKKPSTDQDQDVVTSAAHVKKREHKKSAVIPKR